jgi:hypothetical protein
MDQTITHHVGAPDKPRIGLACNGCGICCLAETCPLGRVVFLQRSGPCPALIWEGEAKRYWCGMILKPEAYISILPGAITRKLSPLFARWVAADIACDSDATIEDEQT